MVCVSPDMLGKVALAKKLFLNVSVIFFEVLITASKGNRVSLFGNLFKPMF